MHKTPNTMKTSLALDWAIQKATIWYEGLSERRKNQITASLAHGTKRLTSTDQLNAYLYHYGEIHGAKLHEAFKHLPNKLWQEDGLSVVDYGCGQGIAEMALSDYLRNRRISTGFIEDFTLVEPSKLSLRQCIKHVSAFFTNSLMTPIAKEDSLLTEDDIKPRKHTVLHILSNVIDLGDFDGRNIANLLANDLSHNNIVICVSPFYQDKTRGKKMHAFGALLRGYCCTYKLENHTDDWDKSYSCQLHIYVSSFY